MSETRLLTTPYERMRMRDWFMAHSSKQPTSQIHTTVEKFGGLLHDANLAATLEAENRELQKRLEESEGTRKRISLALVVAQEYLEIQEDGSVFNRLEKAESRAAALATVAEAVVKEAHDA